MNECLKINIKRIFQMQKTSIDRERGIEISSDIRGLKYILKGDSLVPVSIEHGVFAINLKCIPQFAKEVIEIAEMYEAEQ